MTIQTVSAAQFARMFCLRPMQYAWFLGAGASASAGIPTGYAMITDFKKRIFCELSGVKLKDVDADDPLWTERINTYLASHSNLPPAGDPLEYAAAFEAVHPTPEDRRNYIGAAVEKGTPSYAHRVLASLITTRRVPCIFSPNFDHLVETAAMQTDQLVPASERAHITVAGIDNVERATLALRESRPLLAKIHGDYSSVHIKNTNAELQRQDEQMRQLLTSACGRYGLVIVGYSGRDESVMIALTNAIAQPNAFPGGIHWVTRAAKDCLPAVQQFLESADAAGVRTSIVECHTFDELAADIQDNLTLPAELERHVGEFKAPQVLRPVPLPTQEHARYPILRCAALPVLSMPTVARRITTEKSLSSEEARTLARNVSPWLIVASSGRDIAAFGDDAALMEAFAPVGGRVAGTIALAPGTDSWALGLLYDALTRAVCRRRPLKSRMRRQGHAVISHGDSEKETPEARARRSERQAKLKRAYSDSLYGKTQHGYPFYEGVVLRLESVADRWWLAFEPTTFVDLPREIHEESDDDGADDLDRKRRVDPTVDWRRERWAKRYNNTWDGIIEAWAHMLAGSDNTVLRATGVEEGEGVDAVFELSSVTAWSRPAHDAPYLHRRR
ncbi:SIR2 family protein [Burkholderia stagnalis]|uniref:SIR2 family protein n=1 Tax=Burkholderia stagnalis TaxID=1503054 RepID=UPI0021AB4A73|nr:SIR2 family protein [Burkholderia stagnalis]